MLKVPLENDDIYGILDPEKGERNGYFNVANGASIGRVVRRVLVGGSARMVAIA